MRHKTGDRGWETGDVRLIFIQLYLLKCGPTAGIRQFCYIADDKTYKTIKSGETVYLILHHIKRNYFLKGLSHES